MHMRSKKPKAKQSPKLDSPADSSELRVARHRHAKACYGLLWEEAYSKAVEVYMLNHPQAEEVPLYISEVTLVLLILMKPAMWQSYARRVSSANEVVANPQGNPLD